MKQFSYLGRVLLLLIAVGMDIHVIAQTTPDKSKGGQLLPDFQNADIPGAPRFGKPKLLMSSSAPLFSEGHGWASPAVWDWNQDGKKDLLIGEFTSGMEFNRPVGNFIRVYENSGTDSAPKFSNDFGYARMVEEDHAALNWRKTPDRYPKQLVYYGTPISIPQFCCMAIQPRFADINNDGFPDMYAGNYTPGEVYWFRGSELGFLQGEKLKQYGNASALKTPTGDVRDTSNWHYWFSTQIAFGEFTGDSLQDMIVGGYGGLRMSKNTGTAAQPEFGYREYLLDPQGMPLWKEDMEEAGTPFVVDWDNDGTLDLLVATTYFKKNSKAILFFKGIKKEGSYRFHLGVSLFETSDDVKLFPGDHLGVFVTDWNNDGVNDLLIGAKVALINGVFDPAINWSWENPSTKSSPGYNSKEENADILKKIKAAEKTEREIGKAEMIKRLKQSSLVVDHEKYTTKDELIQRYYGGSERYKTLIHRGYIYLLTGEKR